MQVETKGKGREYAADTIYYSRRFSSFPQDKKRKEQLLPLKKDYPYRKALTHVFYERKKRRKKRRRKMMRA